MKKTLLILVIIFNFMSNNPANSMPSTSKAYFAAGCFWCIQPVFDNTDGVISTTVGYSGITGKEKASSANYESISKGNSGYLEAIEVEYNPSEVSYEKLLELFWQNIDPYDKYGQFCDKGEQYQAAIIYNSEAEQDLALHVADNLGVAEFKTRILRFNNFYPAEEYHQKYYKKNPIRYNLYANSCGRKQRLKELWD